MPKLLVKVFGDPGEDIYELEEARHLFFFTDRIVVVDGQGVHSYEELVKVVSQEKYRDQEFIEVVQIPAIQGG
jgi:hypothetical protein